ncbi:MAG: HEAT repeat domain-containing protein [Lentisphaeria bacterium]|nr:HEAT repeat domain-containing protein [Lentisphaeria bacterium]
MILTSFCLSMFLPLLSAAQTQTLGELSAQYKSSSGLKQRQVARRILALGAEANSIVKEMLDSEDLVIRRNAHRNLRERFGDDALKYYEKALQDPEVMVRSVAVEDLITWKPRSEAVLALLQKAGKDKDNAVRKLAGDAL